MYFDRLISTKIRLSRPPPDVGYRGELEINNLRMAFNINKSIAWATNTASFQIYNMSASNRNELAWFRDEIRIFAGYAQNSGVQLLFIGNTTKTEHSFNYPEIVTTLTVSDGEISFNEVIVAVSFAANTPVRTVINNIAEQMGVNVVFFAQTNNLVYPNGYSDTGLAKNILKVVCEKLNLFPTIQNGNLLIMQNGQGNTIREPQDINQNTGMIGVPERYTDKRQYDYRALPPNGAPKPGWKVRTLLRPDILPGDRIRLRSPSINVNGLFYVEKIQHVGDNYGPQFESIMQVISL